VILAGLAMAAGATAAAMLGLAAGGLGTSVLVQYGPAPAHLVWWLLLGADLAAAAAVLTMPETTPGQPGVLAALRPRVAVPRQARGTFAMALPCLIAVWMISGFYLSLGPSLAAQVLRSPDLLWGGLVIFLLNGIGTAATVVARRASGPAAMLAGCLALLAGTAVTLAAIQTASAAAFLAGTAVAGAGFGTGMLGVFRTISTLAPPGQRAGLIAAYFIASYTAFSIPVVVAGVATTHVGLHRTALVYCAVIAVLAAVAAASLIFRRRSPAGGTARLGEGEMPKGNPAVPRVLWPRSRARRLPLGLHRTTAYATPAAPTWSSGRTASGARRPHAR
jgi:hypothetical protein